VEGVSKQGDAQGCEEGEVEHKEQGDSACVQVAGSSSQEQQQL
jgi:hypothetical protein